MYAYGVSPIARSESMMVRSASNLSKMTTYLAAGKPSQLVPERRPGGRRCQKLCLAPGNRRGRLFPSAARQRNRNELGEKGKDRDLSLDVFPCSLTRHSPPFHLITLSARNSMDCGIVRPICLAVFRLILGSNFSGLLPASRRASRPLESYPHRRQRGGDGKDLFIELGSPTL